MGTKYISQLWAKQQVTQEKLDYEITTNINSGAHAIGVAISANKTNPFGPYFDFGKPIVEDSSGVIDAHWFRDPK